MRRRIRLATPSAVGAIAGLMLAVFAISPAHSADHAIVVTGTVTSEGVPYQGAFVQVQLESALGPEQDNTTTNMDGEYELTFFVEHASEVTVTIAGWKTQQFSDVTAAEGVQYDVDLGEELTIDLTLNATQGGDPLEGFALGVSLHTGGGTGGLTTDVTGTVTDQFDAFVGQPLTIWLHQEGIVDAVIAASSSDTTHVLTYEVIDGPFAVSLESTTGAPVPGARGRLWSFQVAQDFTTDEFGQATVTMDQAIVDRPLAVSLTDFPIDGAIQSEPVTAAGEVTVQVPDLFSDVTASHPFAPAIMWAVNDHITTGYSDGTFRPTATVSRQAVAAFLARASYADLNSPPLVAEFYDVPTTHSFFAEVEWLVAEGIAGGYPDGSFRPTAPVSRQAVAAFIARADGVDLSSPPSEATFSDVPTTHPFFAEIEWLASEGFANGYPDGTFRPTAPVSRQAAVTFLYRWAY